jgi:hypothetical protein
VVAGENDDENGVGRIVGERMHLAIDAGEREIGGGRTDGENGVRLLSGEKERVEKQKQKEKTERLQGASGDE